MKGLLHAPFDRFRIGCFIAENQTLEHTVTFSENHEYTSIILPQQIFSTTDGWIFVDHAGLAVAVLSQFVLVEDKRLFSNKTLPPPVS